MFDNFLSAPLTAATWQIIYWASKTSFSHIINEGHSEQLLEMFYKKKLLLKISQYSQGNICIADLKTPGFFL